MITWAKPKWKERKGGPVRVWSGNRGEYEVLYRQEFYGVNTPSPNYQATVRLKRPDGSEYTFFVEPHRRYRTLKAAQRACETHRKQTCLSTNTPATADTKPKNLRKSRVALASALVAAKRKDSSDKSAKSERLNLEARLSRNIRGESAKVAVTEPNVLTYTDYRALVKQLEGTPDSIEKAMLYMHHDPAMYDLNVVEAGVLDCGLERCACCDWWFECGELVCEENDELTGICPECR